MEAPKIDSRSYGDIVAELEKKAAEYSSWHPSSGAQMDAGGALIRVFARYMELLIDRLNRVPEKQLLAFLNLIGADLVPPRPARVPLTFTPVANSPNNVAVPAGVKVAAPAPSDDDAEVIFETDHSITLTPAQLVAAYAVDPASNRYRDVTAEATGVLGDGFAPFTGSEPFEPAFYLASEESAQLDNTAGIEVKIVAASAESAIELLDMNLTWERQANGGWQRIPVESPIASEDQIQFNLEAPGPLEKGVVNGIESCWLRLRPASNSDVVPKISEISLRLPGQRPSLSPATAFANEQRLDLGRDFLPFGAEPQQHDAFYLSIDALLDVQSDPEKDKTIALLLRKFDDAFVNENRIAWEYWEQGRWVRLAVLAENRGDESTGRGLRLIVHAIEPEQNNSGSSPSDLPDPKLQVRFAMPERLVSRMVNGEPGYWLRARLVEPEPFGSAASYSELKDSKGNFAGYELKPATYHPPSIASIYYSVAYPAHVDIEACLAGNGLTWIDHSAALYTERTDIEPFPPIQDLDSALYLGFDRPLGNRSLSLYVSVAEPDPGAVSATKLAAAAATAPPQIAWEYANRQNDWRSLGALDETAGFMHSNVIRFVGPSDMGAQHRFGKECFWVRARLAGGDYPVPLLVKQIILNTVWASQALSVQDEILGSGTGESNQSFVLAQTPILPGLDLRIREPELLPEDEIAALKRDLGPEAVLIQSDIGQVEEIWVRWQQVPDFYASGPRNRHFTLDALTGVIRFGDGRHGLIPPIGQNNIRARRYRSGGGARGNCAQDTVVQLKSSLPYVDSVNNHVPATGGADQTPLESVKRYGPRLLRHRNRAVTAEDLEDLAYLASPDVARAKAVPPAPQAGADYWLQPGAVAPKTDLHREVNAGTAGLIVVPFGEAAQPVPSSGLLTQVHSYLVARCDPTVRLWVSGPDWSAVDVSVALEAESFDEAEQIEAQVRAALNRYIHPLHGGPTGKGWPYGRYPRESEIFALLQRIGGVKFVHSVETRLLSTLTECALIFPGTYSVSIQ